MSLESAVKALEGSVQSVIAASDSLTGPTQDYNRLKTVLSSNRVFDIISESTCEDTNNYVESLIQPQISSLLNKINIELNSLLRKSELLESKDDLLNVRIDSLKLQSQSNSTDGGDIKKLQLLREKRKRLEALFKS